MERSSLRLPAFLGVLVSVILILAACAPAVTPGAAPREIETPAGFGVEELAGAEEALGVEEFALGEDSFTLELEARAAAEELAKGLDLETMVSEEIAIASLEDELFGVTEAIPAEARGEYHWIPEVADVTVAEPRDFLLEELSGLGVSELVAEERGEVHWPAEFTQGIPSLEEDLSILDLEGIVTEEVAPSFGLEEETITPDTGYYYDY